MPKPTRPDRTLIIRKIPDDLLREFKVVCAIEDVSMQAKVTELMRKYVEEREAK